MYHKWQSYDVWLLRYGVQRTEFFVILDQFLPFYPANNSKNQNFEKMKKPPEDIILHMCSINDNYMICGSWDMEHDGQNFLSCWTIFCPFIPLTSQKIKIKKKEKRKNAWRHHHFTHVYQKWQSYGVWLLRYGAWQREFFVMLDHFLHFYPPNNPKKTKPRKNEKTAWRYHFTHVYHKWQSYDVWFLRYGAWRTEFFVMLDHFLPFYPSNIPKNQN